MVTDPDFCPTHKITTSTGEVEVQLVDGAAYTAEEWESETAADYERDEAGNWTFQGAAFAGAVRPISYEVRMADSVENTGLDGARFPSRWDAMQAAETVNHEHPRAKAEVVQVDGEPTTSFEEWDAAGW